MSPRKVFTAVLAAFVVASVAWLAVSGSRDGGGAAAGDGAREPANGVVAYYFHGTSRCNTCRTIEAYTQTAIRDAFAVDLEKGRLVWRTLNIEEPEHEHFVADYGLTTRTVVLSERRGGREVRWERLERVWDLVGDEYAFTRYIQEETRKYLGT